MGHRELKTAVGGLRLDTKAHAQLLRGLLVIRCGQRYPFLTRSVLQLLGRAFGDQLAMVYDC
jgi:hypothetical protein